jgi:hypothetical protein
VRAKRPTHQNVLYPPRCPPQVISACVPVEKLTVRQYCKHCYRTHRQWWLMDQDDYDVEGSTIILCGSCEHTGAQEGE